MCRHGMCVYSALRTIGQPFLGILEAIFADPTATESEICVWCVWHIA